jgi:hypothetical protein
MRPQLGRRCRVLLRIACAAAFLGGTFGYSDDTPAPPPCKTPLKATDLEPLLQGASRCGDCHSLGKPPSSEDLTPLCRCNERTFWERNDKHQDAYTALAGELAKRINSSRGVSLLPEKDPDCLGCHSMYSLNNLGKSKIGAAVLEEGVSCIACHGAYDNWIDVHGTANDEKRVCWRRTDRKEKEEKWGMTDLWDPVKRTQVCASCHLGDPNPDKHRFLTHAMYAAGHPPLPAFETAAFGNALPRHWQLMNEKTPALQSQDYRWDPNELEQTKLAVIGDAAAFRAEVNLLAAKAEKTPENEGLDFALFDCSSCHHDLKQPSWRQAAGYDGPLGRPGVRRWPPAALDLCLWRAGETEDGRKDLRDSLKIKLAALRAAFTNRPYGDAAQVAEAAHALVQWTDAVLLPRLDGTTARYDATASLALLKQLARDAADPGPGRTPDFDGARQTAWTFRAIYDDMSRALAASKNAETVKGRQALQEKRTAIQEQLDRLETALSLDLPNAKGVSEEDYTKNPDGVKTRRQAELAAFLPTVLKQTADYDPQTVRDAFAELAKLLP